MKVSVIIPNYNHAPFLKQRIDSILDQTFSDFELILLDDCSTDHSSEILMEYSDHPKVSHLIFNDSNSGSPFKQWIKGIKLAKAEWIWIAESDDKAEPVFLQTAMKMITENPNIGLFYADSLAVSSRSGARWNFSTRRNEQYKTDHWSHDYTANGNDEINNYLRFTNTINNTSAVLFRKDGAIENAPKLEEFTYYGDWYLFLTLAGRNRVAYSHLPLSQFREHENSLLNKGLDPVKQRIDYFLLLEHLYELPEISDKEGLVKYFSLQYLNFGFITERVIGNSSYKEWKKINRALAKKVIRTIWYMKLTGKKAKSIY